MIIAAGIERRGDRQEEGIGFESGEREIGDDLPERDRFWRFIGGFIECIDIGTVAFDSGFAVAGEFIA